MTPDDLPQCVHCGMSADICAVGTCPGAPASRTVLERMVTGADSGPDWTRWEDEDPMPYVIRLASQVVFAAGTGVDKAGAVVRNKLWDWADDLLEVAHPTLPPVDIDLS